jgi:hypothetical protein
MPSNAQVASFTASPVMAGVGFPHPSPRPRSQHESAPDRVRDGDLVIQPGTRHAVAPESLHQTQAGSDSRTNGP